MSVTIQHSNSTTKRVLTSRQAASLGRIGGLRTVVRYGPDVIAARAREGLWRKFEREADPDEILPEQERRRRAEFVQRAYYLRLALLSAKARGRKES